MTDARVNGDIGLPIHSSLPFFTENKCGDSLPRTKNFSKGEPATITTPTLIIHGCEDLIPLESSQQSHEAIAGSQRVVLEGIGHIPFVKAPEQFYATIFRCQPSQSRRRHCTRL